MGESSDEFIEKIQKRTSELVQCGMTLPEASELAWFEKRIQEWSEKHQGYLNILVYGDFLIPSEQIDFPEIGITIHPGQFRNTVVIAPAVVEAKVTLADSTVEGVLDAIKRINFLLGVWTVENWGPTIDWWCWVTHGNGGGTLAELEFAGFSRVHNTFKNLPEKVRLRIQSALYWISKSKNSIGDTREDTLRKYAGYWNAFECLVDAICELRPRSKESQQNRQQRLNEYVAQRGGQLTLEDIRHCNREFVDPGLVAKASHAISQCFDEPARYIEECFKIKPKEDRLYNIRNSINHGEIDADNPKELIRVAGKLSRLFIIVWRMLGRLLPLTIPVDPEKR